MKYKKNKKIKIILWIALVISFLIYIVIIFYQAVNNSSKNTIKYETAAPNDYISLFNNSTKQKLILNLGSSFKLRTNISIFIYDTKYNLELTKINTKHSFSIKSDVVETYIKPDESFHDGEWSFNEAYLTAGYKAASTEIPSKIYISLNGDSVKTVLKNDSVASYYLKLNSMDVQYTPSGQYEIYMKAKSKLLFFTIKKPISLMFLKKQNSLYFLSLTANNDSTKLDPNLLYRLVR